MIDLSKFLHFVPAKFLSDKDSALTQKTVPLQKKKYHSL